MSLSADELIATQPPGKRRKIYNSSNKNVKAERFVRYDANVLNLNGTPVHDHLFTSTPEVARDQYKQYLAVMINPPKHVTELHGSCPPTICLSPDDCKWDASDQNIPTSIKAHVGNVFYLHALAVAIYKTAATKACQDGLFVPITEANKTKQLAVATMFVQWGHNATVLVYAVRVERLLELLKEWYPATTQLSKLSQHNVGAYWPRLWCTENDNDPTKTTQRHLQALFEADDDDSFIILPYSWVAWALRHAFFHPPDEVFLPNDPCFLLRACHTIGDCLFHSALRFIFLGPKKHEWMHDADHYVSRHRILSTVGGDAMWGNYCDWMHQHAKTPADTAQLLSFLDQLLNSV